MFAAVWYQYTSIPLNSSSLPPIRILIFVNSPCYIVILYRSQILQYWVPTLIWYFIYDIYAMCDVSYLKIKSERLTMMQRIRKVIAMKQYFILHHLLTFFCSPLVFVSESHSHAYMCIAMYIVKMLFCKCQYIQ